MARSGIKLHPLHRLLIVVTSILLFLSGLCWLIIHYILAVGDPFSPWQLFIAPWSMKLHGALSMIFLIAFGSLIEGHILQGIKSKKHIRSGLSMLGSSALLILTGYGLYYFSGETARQSTSIIHSIIGIAFGVIMLIHIPRKNNSKN